MFLGVVLLLLGAQGLLQTGAALALDATGASTAAVAALGTATFTGMTVGTIAAPALVGRIGNTAVLSAAAGLVAVSIALHPVLPWLPLRFVDGLALAAAVVAMESGINSAVPDSHRGRALGMYITAYYGGMGLAQLAAVRVPFEVGAIPAVLAAGLAIGWRPPRAEGAVQVPSWPGWLPAIGVAGGAIVMGSVFAVGPVHARRVGLGEDAVGTMMALTILGALLLQRPSGALSDRIGRRAALRLGSLGIVAACALAWAFPVVGMAAVGAATATLYPVAASLANDGLADERRAGVAAGIVLVGSLAAALGPMIAAPLMDLTPAGLLVLAGGVGLGVASATTLQQQR